MGVIDEAGYLVTPREFERRMADIAAQKGEKDDDDLHFAGVLLMAETLLSLGYYAGVKIYSNLEDELYGKGFTHD